MRQFRWADGSRLNHIDPQSAGEEIAEIAESNEGFLNAEVIVDAASDENSSLHDAFEWNDAAAAHEHRLEQARKVLRSIRVCVKIESDDGEEEDRLVGVRFIIDAGPEGNRYVRADIVAGDESLRQQALERTIRELRGLRDRHRELNELSHIWAAIDAL